MQATFLYIVARLSPLRVLCLNLWAIDDYKPA